MRRRDLDLDSNGIDSQRRAVANALPGAAALLASGCVNLVPDTPAPTWYLLEDRGGNAQAAGPKIDRTLLIGPVSSSAFYDTTLVAYARAPGTRSTYQFAGWTERPARRIGVLIERRLAARERFAAVAQGTAGIRGDLLLNLTLEQMFHDVSTPPGIARVAMVAELIDWRGRTLLGRRAFSQAIAVEIASSQAAVESINRGIAALLDELCPWIEAIARGEAPQH